MKSRKLRLLFSLLFLAILLTAPLTTHAQAGPTLDVRLYAGIAGPDKTVSTWNADMTTADNADTIKFLIVVENTGGVAADDVTVTVPLPTDTFDTHTFQATVTSANAPTDKDTTQVSINDGPGRVNYLDGTTHIKWDTNGDGTYEYNGIQPGVNTITTSGVTLDTVHPGAQAKAQLKFLISVAVPDTSSADGDTGNGDGTTTTSNSPATSTTTTPPTATAPCTAPKPDAPILTSATRPTGATVNLSWSAVNTATSYHVIYGTASGDYIYGADVGNTTSYTVGDLSPGAGYYFAVKAIRVCEPSDPSNERFVAGSGGAMLAAQTPPPTPQPEVLGEENPKPTPSPTPSPTLHPTPTPSPAITESEQSQSPGVPWWAIPAALAIVIGGFILYHRLWFRQ